MTQNENDANDYTQDINDNFAAAKAAIAQVASNSAPSSLVQTVNGLSNTVNGFGDVVSHDASEFATSNHSHSGMLTTSDIASSVSSSSTNSKPVGAKLFYDTIGNIETLLSEV